MWDTYLIASSVDDALCKLAEHGAQAQIIAGGTDLVLQAQRGQCPARTVVDVTHVPELNYICEQDGYIQIGAVVTHAQIAASPLIRKKANLLAQACASVGGPQIRNVSTLVGNVVNALPAADGAVALFALAASVAVASLDGQIWMPIEELYEGVGECTLDPCTQMVTALRFRPLASCMGCDFQRLARRRVLVLPIVNAGVVVHIRDNVFVDARIAVGPVSPVPFRATAAEHALIGQPVNASSAARAAELAARDARPRSSTLRGSKDYRTAMVSVLVRRALGNAARQLDLR
jgi:CO/xanthine dehydrogenase FAD-binding subunit